MLGKILSIGNMLSKENASYISNLIEVRENPKDIDKEKIVLKLVFDLDINEIRFDIEKIYNSEDVITYNLFKNPGGKSKQFCLTRISRDIEKFLGKIYIDFLTKLNEQKTLLEEETYEFLKTNIKKIINSELYDLKDKNINFSKLNLELNKDNLSENTLKNSIQELIPNPRNTRIIFLVPEIIENNISIKIVNSKEYKEFLKSTLKTKSNKQDYCYCCGEKKENIINAVSFRGKAFLSMIYTTTNINSSSNIKGNKQYYKDNYRVCEECFNKISIAETYINKNLKFKMAGIDTYIIPKFYYLNKNFEFNFNEVCKYFKSKISNELGNLSSEVYNFNRDILDELEYIDETMNYELNFINHEYTGQAFKLVNILQDISKLNYIETMERLSSINKFFFKYQFRGSYKYEEFQIGSIYRFLPLRNDKKGNLIQNQNKVLDIYNFIFKREQFSKYILFESFCEAIKKLYYSNDNTTIIYKNILQNKSFDFLVQDYIFCYLIMIRLFTSMDLLLEEEKGFMQSEYQKSLYDEFLNEQKFNEQQRALFFLGALISEIGSAQYRKGHDKKPILNKLSFQGMNLEEIKYLSNEIYEKLIQYQILFPSVEECFALFKNHFDKNVVNWKLNEQENIFYILSGYAFKTNQKFKKNEENEIVEIEGGKNDKK
ncbi:type I-B CRISPR-associated protein Cas8b/Csh1 [uncultured Ilyobacter sp.]|uniref:type I-B CRISPR-associated protein Cas8b/Csh1 n=1 Tax=uncultured Ilyobacter sp. TaxID=544433 RepID=UPI002AA69BA6|nr:type I-B CRISPR-associated protein Cas8b/Csh1 [uncultured Ilyobacter sp.]